MIDSSSAEIVQRTPTALVSDQVFDVKSVSVEDPTAAVGSRNESRTTLAEKTRGMHPDSSKPLNGDPGATQVKIHVRTA